ncbi:MAG TPA: arylamine N-acetyltransferase, partial [Candidatus Berkiella sp.]|nr:arylamine N-acetyltransferase [Candidatus Berkiella sp.]
MATKVQIKEYLKKIGFEGEPSVTLECLTKIVEGHSFTFPFETLSLHDSHLDHRPNHRTSLNFKALFRKLIHKDRGGRCVELNTLLQTMLKTLGFKVKPIIGEDLFMSAHLPRNKRPQHSAGIVKINNKKFLVDAAFGGIGIIAPIPLKAGE